MLMFSQKRKVLCGCAALRVVILLSVFVLCVFTPFRLLFAIDESIDSVAESIIASSLAAKLYDESVWRRLLYYDGGQSEVVSKGYFLSASGHEDPKAELVSTIRAYFLPWPDNRNLHAICKFPSRYFWINKHFPLPALEEKLSDNCDYLNRWVGGFDKRSVSLVLVSGFLGNPASSFGHALLKLNSAQNTRDVDFFDKTVNYGANVPDGEHIVRYIFRGIFGFYDGRFSDEYFFTQDRVYTRTEFRDMWEYKLDLSQSQLKLLFYHVWEVRGYKFRYFFFDRNCAYRIAQIIDLVAETDLAKDYRPWYLPERPFQDIFSIKNKSNAGKSLLQSVLFIPSSQRVLYGQLAKLSGHQLGVLQRILLDDATSFDDIESFSSLSESERRQILDALLAYIKYKKIALTGEPLDGVKSLEHRVLLNRLRMKPAPPVKGQVVGLSPPSDGNAPSYAGVGLRHEGSKSGYVFEVGAFKRDIHTRNSLEGNELRVLNLRWAEQRGSAEVTHFTLVEASNLKPSRFNLAREKKWSWRMALGAERVESGAFPMFMNFAFGESVQVAEGVFGFGMINTYLYTGDDNAAIGGLLGARFLGEKFSVSVEYEPIISEQGQHTADASVSVMLPLGATANWVTTFGRRESMSFQSTLNYYF